MPRNQDFRVIITIHSFTFIHGGFAVCFHRLFASFFLFVCFSSTIYIQYVVCKKSYECVAFILHIWTKQIFHLIIPLSYIVIALQPKGGGGGFKDTYLNLFHIADELSLFFCIAACCLPPPCLQTGNLGTIFLKA